MLNSCKVRRNTQTREVEQVVIDRPFTDERANVIYNYFRSIGIPIHLGAQAMQEELLRIGYNLDFQIIGERGVANLEDKVAILSMLDLASEMFDKGKTNDEIWLTTGWYREDGRWKTEVEYGELNPILTEEILSQPLLTVNLGGLYNGKVMELYPELQEIEVIFQPLEGGMLGGTYGNQIVIDSNLSRVEKEKVLIHEVQHIIQRLEGFLIGANPNIIEQELSYRFEQVNKRTPNEAEQNKIREIANNLYTRWAGEVEARNASQRAELSSVQRREYSPEITGDIPPIFSIEKGDQFFKDLADDGHLQFLSTPSGEVYGFVNPEGEMFIDPEVAGVSTLIHEGAHIQYKVLKRAADQGDPKAKAILAKIKEITKPVVESFLASKSYAQRNDLVFETEGLGSPVYNQREGETDSQYRERIEEEFFTRMIGNNTEEYLESLGLTKQEAKNLLQKLQEYLEQFVEWLRGKKGFQDLSVDEINKLSVREFLDRSTTSMMLGEFGSNPLGRADGQYFERNADRLPLTLAIFNRPEFKAMQGKMVNPITVLNSLNQSGIKQIEKDLIKQIIQDNYQGQKKISYDELEATVRANIVPLERIFTSSYADYGMDNLGDGNYGEANTIILNSPIEHGVTGHFSGDFKASGRKSIKYVPKQLNDNTWVAVEEGYESQTNDNNIYQFVGTAGTKEAVDAWIKSYEKPTSDTYSVSDKNLTFEIDRIDYGKEVDEDLWTTQVTLIENGKIVKKQTGFPYNISEEDAKRQIVDLANGDIRRANKDINKGMFGHIRVWQDGQDFYVAELQSDYFQKNNARKGILESKKEYKEVLAKKEDRLKEIKTEEDLFFTDYQNLFLTELEKLENVEVKPHNLVFTDGTVSDEEYLWLFVNGESLYKSNYNTNSNYSAEMQRTSIIKGKNLKGLIDVLGEDKLRKIDRDVRKPIEHLDTQKKQIEKEFNNSVENIIKNLPKEEKQFIASQKEWEKRMVREAIKEASLSGATSLRFPTPYTLSVIEGYLSEGAPYEIEDANDSTYLEAGDRIYYAGEDYTVVDSDNTTITIAESVRVRSAEEQDIISQEVDNAVDNDMYEIENNLKGFYTQEEWNGFRDNYRPISSTELDEVGNEIEEGVFEVSEGKIKDIVSEYYNNIFTDAESIIKEIYGNDVWVYGDTVIWTDGTANIETLMQPSEYKGQGTKDSFSIENDLDDTQQTVARKYQEIAEILKAERGDNFEVITDENGFDWYETKITPEEVNSPVVAFQAIGEQGTTSPESPIQHESLLTTDLKGNQEFIPANKIITYNSEGGDINYKVNPDGTMVQLKTVTTSPQQQESITYKQILSIPSLSKEQALQAYTNLYSTDFFDWNNTPNNCK